MSGRAGDSQSYESSPNGVSSDEVVEWSEGEEPHVGISEDDFSNDPATHGVAVAAELLGLDACSLESALAEMEEQPIHSVSSNHFHDKKKHNESKKSGAHPGSLALARVLHRTLFDWLVGCANAAAAPPDAANFRSGRTVWKELTQMIFCATVCL